MPAKNIDELIALCKRRGFIFQSSEIYGGTQGLYDYGPLGVELKNNIIIDVRKNHIIKRYSNTNLLPAYPNTNKEKATKAHLTIRVPRQLNAIRPIKKMMYVSHDKVVITTW